MSKIDKYRQVNRVRQMCKAKQASGNPPQEDYPIHSSGGLGAVQFQTRPVHAQLDQRMIGRVAVAKGKLLLGKTGGMPPFQRNGSYTGNPRKPISCYSP